MEFDNVLSARYSVRKFSDRPIEKEKLDKILQAGRICPTATNAQPQRIYVLDNSRAFEKLKDTDKMRFGAPVVLLVCADLDATFENPLQSGYKTAEMDASICATYMMLKATDLGLGSLWVRYFNADVIRESFGLEKNILPCLLMPIGYRRRDAAPSPRHNQRKPIEEIVTYL
jgi:nitroreductase